MQLQSLWVLVLTSLLVLLKPLNTEALSLSNINRLVVINSTILGEISPVFPDYLQRSHIISVYEEEVAKSPDSSIFLRLLADQYLRRFREVGDLEDVLRAELSARKSLKLQPQNNQLSSMLLASSLLSQHKFREALDVLPSPSPDNTSLLTLKASILMELGDYQATHELLELLPKDDAEGTGQNAVMARYLELTGNIASAKQILEESMEYMDYFYSNPAETRAWFHVRNGDLAFATGDYTLSEQRYQEALELFPGHLAALTGLARLYASQHRWHSALNAANQGIERIPLVETLGYKADAERALGDPKAAKQTEDLIGVVAYLSKVKGIYDRALAVYYIEHEMHLKEALEIALREVEVRDDIYAEDTLAWAAAANGQWNQAQKAASKATRYGTEDALIQFHAAVIALHLDAREEAKKRLTQALKLSPQFHHKYADEARQLLANLEPAGGV